MSGETALRHAGLQRFSPLRFPASFTPSCGEAVGRGASYGNGDTIGASIIRDPRDG